MTGIINSFKGTDAQLKCRGKQYEIGGEYEIDGEVKVCENGFHACQSPLDVFDYYAPANSRYFSVEQSGECKTDGDKTTSQKLKIMAEIGIIGLVKAHVDYVMSKITKTKTKTNEEANKAASNSGDRGAASNSGDYGAASNSGCRGAASNSGDRGAASNSGDRGAASNSGYRGAASNSGCRGAASNSGCRGAASNSGDYGAASNSGDYGIAVAWGINSRVKLDHIDSYGVLGDWRKKEKDGEWYLHTAHLIKPGGKLRNIKISVGVWYWFEGGKLECETANSK